MNSSVCVFPAGSERRCQTVFDTICQIECVRLRISLCAVFSCKTVDMALSKAAADDLTHLITCAVCLERFTNRDPRVLACLHSFCYDCLHGIYTSKTTTDPSTVGSISCPTCMEVTALPGGSQSLRGLKSYFVAEQMSDVLAKLSVSSVEPCDVLSTLHLCTRCRQSKDAVAYCFDCAQPMCGTCLGSHDKKQSNTNHVNIRVNRNNITSLVCKDHGEFAMDYCWDCSCIACLVCHSSTHQDHKRVEFCLTSDELKSIAQNLDTVTKSCSQRISHYRKHHKEHEQKIQLIENQIDENVHVMITMITSQGEAMKTKARETIKPVDVAITTAKGEYTNLQRRVRKGLMVLKPLTNIVGLSLSYVDYLKADHPPDTPLCNYQQLNFTPNRHMSVNVGQLLLPVQRNPHSAQAKPQPAQDKPQPRPFDPFQPAQNKPQPRSFDPFQPTQDKPQPRLFYPFQSAQAQPQANLFDQFQPAQVKPHPGPNYGPFSHFNPGRGPQGRGLTSYQDICRTLPQGHLQNRAADCNPYKQDHMTFAGTGYADNNDGQTENIQNWDDFIEEPHD